MRIVLVFLVVSLAGCAHVSLVAITEPTVVAFVESDHLSSGEADVISDDFHYYLPAIRGIAQDLGASFLVREKGAFRVDGQVLATAKVPVGLVLAAPGKQPQVLRGVHTDVDFACAAQAYFARRSSACPNG